MNPGVSAPPPFGGNQRTVVIRIDPDRLLAYNMSPEAYRERWKLSSDYPMVAPNYARQRSRLAKEIGLGTRARRARA